MVDPSYYKKKAKGRQTFFLIYTLLFTIYFIIELVFNFQMFTEGGGVTVITMACIFVIPEILSVISWFRSSRNFKKTLQKQIQEVESKGIDGELKAQILGMIKAHNQIEFNGAEEILGIDKDFIRQLLQDLLSEGKIKGGYAKKDLFKGSSNLISIC